MSIRTRRRQSTESVAQAALVAQHKPWVSARDLALLAGIPWRPMARALRRLAARGDIETKEVFWRDKKSRVRRSRLYRGMVGFDVSVWPESLMPRPKMSLRSSARKAQLKKENEQ